MNNISVFKKLVAILVVLVATFFSIIAGQSVYADDGAAGSAVITPAKPRTTNIGYGRNYGATWVYYQYTGTGGDVTIRREGDSGGANWATIPAKCREFGGFYVLMNLEHENGKLDGKLYGANELRYLKEYGGGYVYQTQGKISLNSGITAGDAVVSRYGEPLVGTDSVQSKFESLSDEGKMGQYWGPGSELSWFCYGEKGGASGSNVYSTSSVTFGGSTQTSSLDGTTTMIIPSSSANSSSTVVFTHRIVTAKDPATGPAVTVNWSIGGQYASSNNPPSGTVMLNSSGWSARADGKWEKIVSTSVNVPVGTSGRFCQTISYNPKNYTITGNNISGSGTGSSTACINLRPVVIPTPTCAALGGVSTKSANYGDTNGTSKVMNASNVSGDTGWLSTVWAKPGDTVSFAHCFSWGVQAVTKSDDYGGRRSSPSTATSLSDRVNESWFQIGSNRGNQYLFGLRKDQGTIGPRVTLQRFNSIARNISNNAVISAESNGNYELVLMSPSKNAVDANRYNCLIFDFTGFIANGFQVPGFESWRGSCAASNATGRTNEVGTTISQQITYPYQQAWVYESWSESGRCNCATNDTASDHWYYNNNNLLYPGGNGSISNDNAYHASFWNCQNTTCSSGLGVNKCANYSFASGCGCASDGKNYCETSDCIVGYHKAETDTGGITYEPDYGCCGAVEATGSCSGSFANKSVSTRHPVRFRDYGNRTSVANVNIPYNFRTADTSSINAGSTIYAGETVSSAFTASVLPVVNSAIKSTTSAYATVYPGDIRIEQFIIGPNASIPAQTSGAIRIGSSMCNYFGGTQCGTIPVSNTGNNWKNAEGRYNGWTWSMSATYNVPNNADIGSKYCVAIGMTIANSHPNGDSGTVSGWHNFDGRWRVSLSCRTIAKKPNFQAWNANLYSQADIDTVISSKYEDAVLGSNRSANKIFGSWEEYLAISKGDITGFASGAALGYEGSTMRITGGHSPTGNFCDLSHMSISNENCNHIGLSRISLSNAFISRVATRYNPVGMAVNSGENINVAAASPLTSTADGSRTAEYILTSGDGTINGTVVRSASSPVLVIRVPGTLTINSNICYGSGSCQGYDNALVLGSRNSQRFSSISEIPQVILIANRINISENVTQLDAWLVAVGSSGTVDTCYQLNMGVSSSDNCSKTLIVNGPTFANSILLNRTAGAYTRSTFGQNDRPGAENNLTDDGSMTPAEIFNYRPDTLLWSYQQSQNFSQATITYSRELSPRY